MNTPNIIFVFKIIDTLFNRVNVLRFVPSSTNIEPKKWIVLLIHNRRIDNSIW